MVRLRRSGPGNWRQRNAAKSGGGGGSSRELDDEIVRQVAKPDGFAR
jgi:hypothetical protein